VPPVPNLLAVTPLRPCEEQFFVESLSLWFFWALPELSLSVEALPISLLVPAAGLDRCHSVVFQLGRFVLRYAFRSSFSAFPPFVLPLDSLIGMNLPDFLFVHVVTCVRTDLLERSCLERPRIGVRPCFVCVSVELTCQWIYLCPPPPSSLFLLSFFPTGVSASRSRKAYSFFLFASILLILLM